jgi:hypothetical protein
LPPPPTFGYDADVNALSSINLVTTNASSVVDGNFVAVDPCCLGGVPTGGFLLFVTSAVRQFDRHCWTR